MSNEFLATVSILAALGSVTAVIGFFMARMKDAEGRGRQAQRLDHLEGRMDATNIKIDKILEKLEEMQKDQRLYYEGHISDFHGVNPKRRKGDIEC
jgi:Mg2+ and Co2+ transporter CorA